MDEIPTSLLKRALAFYEESPDGQYDLSVVAPVLEAVTEGTERLLVPLQPGEQLPNLHL